MTHARISKLFKINEEFTLKGKERTIKGGQQLNESSNKKRK